MGEKHRPVISVIIPSWNNAVSLETLFASLSRQSFNDFEVILVDKHSKDGTEQLAERSGAKYFGGDMGRSEARNFGASQSLSDFLLFLDSDMEPSADVLSDCIKNIGTHSALCVREQSATGRNYWAKARALERDSFFGTLYYESARFFRRDVFIKLGGYDANMVGYEDLDLQARLLESGQTIGWADSTIYHHEEAVGLIAYLDKRRLYSTTADIYANRHGGYWKELSSVSRRYQLILRALSSSSLLDSLYLLPGLMLMRCMEFIMVRRKTLVTRK